MQGGVARLPAGYLNKANISDGRRLRVPCSDFFPM